MPTEISAAEMRALEEEMTQLNKKLYDLRETNKKRKVGTPEWFEANGKVTFLLECQYLVAQFGLSHMTIIPSSNPPQIQYVSIADWSSHGEGPASLPWL